MRKVISYSFFCTGIAFFLSTTCPAQGKADTAKLKNDKTLSAVQVKAKFDEKNADKGVNAVKKMSQSLQSKGFKAESTYFGTETSLEKDGKTITHTILIQDYSKGNTKAAVGSVVVSDGTNQESYTFSLERTGNDPTDVKEDFINDKMEVTKANSWYTCLYKTLQSKCGSISGLNLLKTCWNAYASWSWTSFLSCIKSSWCGISSIACCTCDCSWTCKWAVGCCDR